MKIWLFILNATQRSFIFKEQQISQSFHNIITVKYKHFDIQFNKFEYNAFAIIHFIFKSSTCLICSAIRKTASPQIAQSLSVSLISATVRKGLHSARPFEFLFGLSATTDSLSNPSRRIMSAAQSAKSPRNQCAFISATFLPTNNVHSLSLTTIIRDSPPPISPSARDCPGLIRAPLA